MGLAINIPAVEDSDLDGFSSVLMMIAWIGALVHALVIRGTWVRRVRERATSPMAAARRRLEERERAHRLAGADPRLARELGVGRPDVTGAEVMGVIDVNHVPARVLAQLPGLDGDLAQRIVEVREEIDGFSSAEDLGHVLGLDADVVDRLGERTVYLPR